jgi:DNA-binding NarL/FixJ family response regulator
VGNATIVRASAALGLVEAAHDGQGDWQEWCARLLDASEPFFLGSTVNLGILRRHPAHYEVIANTSASSSMREILRTQVTRAEPAELDPFGRYPAYVSTMKSLLTGGPPTPAVGEFLRMIDHADVLGLVGIADDYSVSIGGPYPVAKLRIPARDRQVLLQVALHLEAGLRLRLQKSAVIGVLTPDGRFVHAEGSLGRAPGARNLLTEHVTRVESARTRRGRAGPAAADAWSALVGGDWGIVDRTDRDGRRHYVVIETQCAPRIKALSPLETQVAELSARGLTGKGVAYALGLTGPQVSQALFRAALKLGRRSRTELVALVARLLGTPREAEQQVSLTPAERDVLSLVRMGLTNAAIADARRRSERTVANQVASLLRKLDAPSRRSLAATG